MGTLGPVGTVDLNMPVLVVDDYQTMIRTMGKLLRKLGFENIDEASDGHQALEKLRSGAYGLVISGTDMQPMSGLDLVRQMRADSDLERVRCVLVSSEAEGAQAAKQAGASDHIVKPFSASTLKDRLIAILGQF